MCRGAAEYRTVQGSLLNPRQDIHYSHKLPSQQNRRAGFTERVQPSLISCSKPYFPAWYGNPPTPPPPNPCFSIVPAVLFPQWQPENMQKVAIRLRRVTLSSISCQEERERISSPDKRSICVICECVPLMWFPPRREYAPASL